MLKRRGLLTAGLKNEVGKLSCFLALKHKLWQLEKKLLAYFGKQKDDDDSRYSFDFRFRRVIQVILWSEKNTRSTVVNSHEISHSQEQPDAHTEVDKPEAEVTRNGDADETQNGEVNESQNEETNQAQNGNAETQNEVNQTENEVNTAAANESSLACLDKCSSPKRSDIHRILSIGKAKNEYVLLCEQANSEKCMIAASKLKNVAPKMYFSFLERHICFAIEDAAGKR